VARVFDLETSVGTARAHIQPAQSARGVLFLGHGAGGGVTAPDLTAASAAALADDVSVVLVEQPYRVAGRRSPEGAPRLDAGWLDVVSSLRTQFAGLPLIVGGRSSGARVACRTADAAGAAGVLCLAFPVHPPGRPEKSRLDELRAVRVPVLVVQGETDPFGRPPRGRGRRLVLVRGDHGLKADLPGLQKAVRRWLREVLVSSEASRTDRFG
jgi:predicted alpha/beta-hydrolase family hydrolase